MTQHYTLEQVEKLINGKESLALGDRFRLMLASQDIHALINEAITQRIGEPVAEVTSSEQMYAGTAPKVGWYEFEIERGTKLFALKEIPK